MKPDYLFHANSPRSIMRLGICLLGQILCNNNVTNIPIHYLLACHYTYKIRWLVNGN